MKAERRQHNRKSRSFAATLRALAPIHSGELWRRAVLANDIGKMSQTPSAACRRKGQYLSALYRMGKLCFFQAEELMTTVLLSVSFSDGDRLHTLLNQLDGDVQRGLAEVVARLLLEDDATPTTPYTQTDPVSEMTLLGKGA